MTNSSRQYSFKVRLLGCIAVTLFGVLIPLELISYTFSSFLSKRGLLYKNLAPPAEAFSEYLAARDPVLGWPNPKTFGGDNLDSIGSRINPHYPNHQTSACISAYGDSFTYSSEVSIENAWTSVLSKKIGCRVNNFGVGGYGTDQSLMRLLKNKFDRPQVLILGHASLDIQRNVNQFRGLLTGRIYGFKPRYLLDKSTNRLGRIDLIDFTGINFEEVYANPANFLAYEYHLPTSPPGTPTMAFPYSMTVALALRTRKVTTFYKKSQVYYDDFYEPGHASGALEITQAILSEFVDEAHQRNSQPLVVLFPIAEDMMKFEATGEWSYQNLIAYMELNDIDYLNVGNDLNQYLSSTGKEICDLYQHKWYAKGGCTGHFQEVGYGIVGEAVYNKLKEVF